MRREPITRQELADRFQVWVAQEKTDEWWIFIEKPTLHPDMWIAPRFVRQHAFLFEITDPPKCWKDSLTSPSPKHTCWSCGISLVCCRRRDNYEIVCPESANHVIGPTASTPQEAWKAYEDMCRHGAEETKE